MIKASPKPVGLFCVSSKVHQHYSNVRLGDALRDRRESRAPPKSASRYCLLKLVTVFLTKISRPVGNSWGQGGCGWVEVVYNGDVVGDSGILDLVRNY